MQLYELKTLIATCSASTPDSIACQAVSQADTTDIKDMSELFKGFQYNIPLEGWVTSNVTDMSSMFWGAINFNQPINNWDTSKVRDMSGMFRGAIRFNQPLSSWSTSNVVMIQDMFNNAKKL